MPVAFEPILPHIPGFLMVMFRLTGLFIFGPVYGSGVIPMQLKALLALVLAFCLYPLIPFWDAHALTLPELAIAVAGELLIGLVIGYGAALPLVAMQMGGQIISQQMGLGLAQIYSPEFNEQTDVLGQLFFLAALAIFLLLNGHHAMLGVLVRSFQSVPMGGYVPDGHLLQLVTGLLTSMLELALRVGAPLLCIIFLESIATGFIARTVPQINILSLGFPLRILLGMGVVVALIAPAFEVVAGGMRQMINLLFFFFSG